MKRLTLATAIFGAASLWAAASFADLLRDPNGVNVSTSGPTTLTIRFAEPDAGDTFTTNEAVFCSIDPCAGAGVCPTSCTAAGGRILGRLPAGADRGSTSSASSSITDIMTIPFSVTRRAVVQARAGAQSDFFYVRRFDPVGGADLGAGAGTTAYVVVTCRLTSGISRSPLSLTRVQIFGDEGDGDRKLLVRVDDENRDVGVVKAEIDYTGTGVLSGWWEVRTPSDPSLQEIDRFTEGSLTETERQQQQRFLRVKRIRLQVPLRGKLTLKGPRYSELPQQQPGVYQLLLRIEATRDREALSRVAGTGGSPALFSGGAAGFALPVLEYRVLNSDGVVESQLSPRLVIDRGDSGTQFSVAWSPAAVLGPFVQIEARNAETDQSMKILARMDKGFAIFPRRWTDGKDMENWSYVVTVLGPDRRPIGEPTAVATSK